MLTPQDLSQKKVLFIIEAVTLAHVARSVMLGRQLEKMGAKMHYAFAPHFDSYKALELPPHEDIFTISSEKFLSLSSAFKFAYSIDEIRKYIAADIHMMERHKPDFVIGDIRLSLVISARNQKIPYICMGNSYWFSSSLKANYIPPGRGPMFLNDTVFSYWIRPIINLGYCLEGLPFRKLAKEYGVETSPDVRDIYSGGDFNWCPEPEDLVELGPNNKKIHYLGPLQWFPKVDFPKGYHQWRAGEKVIYINMGSSGDPSILISMVESLIELAPKVKIVVGSKNPNQFTQERVFAAEFWPNHEMIKHSHIFIANGGSPSGYLAMEKNIPLLGVVSNLDQVLCMRNLQAKGFGKMVYARSFSLKKFNQAFQQLWAPIAAENTFLKKSA